MGTSQSSPGPGGGSPLVPPWADSQPEQPLPEPETRRFKPFRQSLGDFIKSGDSGDLRSALGHYARRASGGSAVASRRMGAVTNAGASLYGALLGSPFGAAGEKSINLSGLAGKDCSVAIDAITTALTPDGGDSDKIRAAINLALVDALDGVVTFDPTAMTDDVIMDTMIGYLAESIFLHIVTEGGNAWTKAETPVQEISAEIALRELVKVLVDKYMASKLSGKVRSFTQSEFIKMQRQVIAEVWTEWEAYK